ncbi:valyl tRNA synthetase tRNA binding arm [Bacteriovorax sp. BSW11_IV]|nr:valyl tRNA synthetase tRNA binding arm [Bacteriovorax sp. BSW11_IV]
MLATTHTEIFLPLEGVIDLNEQISRLEKELVKTQKEYEKYAKKISNAKFMDNAPPEVVTEVRENAASLEEKMKSIEENLKNFKN